MRRERGDKRVNIIAYLVHVFAHRQPHLAFWLKCQPPVYPINTRCRVKLLDYLPYLTRFGVPLFEDAEE
jgi:hypothetical protein